MSSEEAAPVHQVVVAVASKSKPKIEAAQSGFARLLPDGYTLKVIGVEASSGVADQPIGFEETRLGARNRLSSARASEEGSKADFCIAYEGGVENDSSGRKVCFAIICVKFRDNDYVSETRSATHSLPLGIEKLLAEGIELGVATDKFFTDHLPAGYGKASGGTIGALTRGIIDRVEFYAHPTALALVPFVNGEVYGINNPLGHGFAVAGGYVSRQSAEGSDSNFGGCIVLLRHGEREDYMAEKAGNGATWIASAGRPWDPRLAENGRQQARAAAKRLRQILLDNAIPPPSRIYTSPLERCIETAGFVAEEFNVSSLLVEEGLVETICEGWMRQFAVPCANSAWGGPPEAAMPKQLTHNYVEEVQGPPIPEKDLIPEAVKGVATLLRTAADLKAAGWDRVDARHGSHVDVRKKKYCWGHFETRSNMKTRIESTLKHRLTEHPKQTLVFVSHGGPTSSGFEVIKGVKAAGEGGMTAMSVLRVVRDGESFRWEDSEVILGNDASHAEEFKLGEETII